MILLEDNKSDIWSPRKLLCFLFFLAFSLRFGFGVFKYYFGIPFLDIVPVNWWGSGYSQYSEIAINFVEGKGLTSSPGSDGFVHAMRPPLYPLFLSVFYFLFGKISLPPIFFHSLIGTCSVVLIFRIAKRLFNNSVAILASLLAAIYPYYVVHDTALQETSFLTFLMVLSIFCFFKAIDDRRKIDFVYAGISLGLTALVKETMLILFPFVIIWFLLNSNKKYSELTKRLLLFSVCFILVISTWIVRNYFVHGKAVFKIGSGVQLWTAHNPDTLSYYPWSTLCMSTHKALARISKEDRKKLEKMTVFEQNDEFTKRALDFAFKNPFLEVKYAAVKVFAGFSPMLSPTSENFFKRFFYSLSYTPVLFFGIIGIYLGRKQKREHSIFYFMFFSFALVSAIAWAHTTYRLYLDTYLIIFASYSFLKLFPKGKKYL